MFRRTWAETKIWLQEPRTYLVKDAVALAGILLIFALGSLALIRAHDAASLATACEWKLQGTANRLRQSEAQAVRNGYIGSRPW